MAWAWLLLAVFYVLMGLIVWQGTHADNRDRPPWLGPTPSPVLRGVFWFPMMLVAILMLLADLVLEAGGLLVRRK